MDTAVLLTPVIEDSDLLKELDKGIDDMENDRLTPHEDSMQILIQRYDKHVLQDS